MTARAVLLLAAGAACSAPPRAPMYPAGSDKDDGYGDLAQQSAHLLTSAEEPPPLTARHHRHRDGEPYGGGPYGAAYTDDADDSADGPDLPRPLHRLRVRGTTHDAPAAGLTGAIEGTITWRGARPPALTTPCGAIEPGVHVAAGGAVAGVLIYIEHVDAGRAVPSYTRTVSVGGTIAKHGCALAPALQILTPLPASLAIHGDATEATLRITLPTTAKPTGLPGQPDALGPPAPPGDARPYPLQPAGRVVIQAQPGVTRVEADDGSLAAAWVIASDTPYYAITDDAGRFRIDELAAGSYDLTIVRPPLAAARNGKLVYGAPVVVHRTVKVDATRPAHLDVALGP